MINRRSVPALHRACLHQYHQPETENSGREFSCKPIENGHDSPVGRTRWCWVVGWMARNRGNLAGVSGIAGQPGTYIRWNFHSARLAPELIAGAEDSSGN